MQPAWQVREGRRRVFSMVQNKNLTKEENVFLVTTSLIEVL